jgi:hypothetical protein
VQCGADDMWLGSYGAMTVFMDMVRFVTTRSSFLSPEPELDETYRNFPGGEVHVNWLAWRTGIHLLHFQTHTVFFAVTVTPSCYQKIISNIGDPDHFQTLTLPGNECQRFFAPDKFQALRLPGNECQRLGVEPLRIPRQYSASEGLLAEIPWDENSCHDPATGRSLEWHAGRGKRSGARPACNNVTNLATHNPLGNCRRRDDNAMSWKAGAHRVFVERGFGMPLIFENSTGSLLRC